MSTVAVAAPTPRRRKLCLGCEALFTPRGEESLCAACVDTFPLFGHPRVNRRARGC